MLEEEARRLEPAEYESSGQVSHGGKDAVAPVPREGLPSRLCVRWRHPALFFR